LNFPFILFKKILVCTLRIEYIVFIKTLSKSKRKREGKRAGQGREETEEKRAGQRRGRSSSSGGGSSGGGGSGGGSCGGGSSGGSSATFAKRTAISKKS